MVSHARSGKCHQPCQEADAYFARADSDSAIWKNNSTSVRALRWRARRYTRIVLGVCMHASAINHKALVTFGGCDKDRWHDLLQGHT
jgi:hypothetical protein